MQEALKRVTSNSIEQAGKSVTLCIQSNRIRLNGIWNWEMQSPAVYCSDVMSFPDQFAGTKGIFHPDDLPKLIGALSIMDEKEVPRLDFRIITTYGEVKIISGQRVSIENEKNKIVEPIPGKEPWEEALQLLVARKENDFLKLKNELTEYTERLHGIGSWLINKQSGLTWYSDNVFRIYGLAPQSLNAHANTFNHFIHKDDRINVLDAFEKAYENHAPLHIEYRIVLNDGEIRFIQQVTKWLYAISGQEIFSGIVRDVTVERAIEDELLLAQSQSLLYQQVLKMSDRQSVSGYWLMNLATRKTSYSENYYRIYGFKQAFLPNYNSFLNLVHSDDRAKVHDLIDKMYNEHSLPETEFRIIRPDGKQRYLQQSGKLFISPNKELYMIGVVQDISMQKGLEKKIAELNEKISLNNAATEMMENAVEASSFVWLPDGYMQWSDGFYKMLGYKPGGIEPLPRFLYKRIHPADLKTFKDAEALLLNHQSHEDISIRFVSKGGIRKVRISFQQLNYGKDATIALVHDVSRQTELSEQFVNIKLFSGLMEESVTDMVIFTNTDHIILHWNRTAEEKTGIKKEEALHQNLFDILPRLNEESFLTQLHWAVRGNEAHSSRMYDVYFRKPHDYRLFPLKNEKEEVIGVLHVVQDVSKQLELQQQLSERLNFIESLVESSVDRIVVLDRFMNYLYWNKKAEEYYAVSKERVLGKNILEVFPSFRNHPGYNEFRKVLKGETVYLSATGNENDEYFETYLIPIKDEGGDVTAVLWTVHDLSREYQLTKERTQTANLLQATMDASKEMIQVFEAVRNSEGEIVDFKYLLLNHEAEKWTPDAIGKSLLQLQPGVVEEGIFDTFKNVVETGIPDQSERHYVHEQFNGWFYQSTVKLNDGVTTTTRNITDRKKAEEEVIRTKEFLQATLDSTMYVIQAFHAVRDEAGRIIDFVWTMNNQKGIEQNGDVIGQSLLKLNPGVVASGLFEKFVQVTETGIPVDHEVHYSYEQFNGWYHQILVKMDDGFVMSTENITERKKAEQEILRLKEEAAQRAADQYYTLFNSVDDGFCVIELIYDDTGRAVDFIYHNTNPSFVRQTGIEMEGKKQSEIFADVDQSMLDKYDDVVKTGEPVQQEYMIEGLNNRWFQTKVSRVGEKGSNRVAVIFRDITERKIIEEKTKNFNADLEQQITERTKELQKQLTLLRYTEYLAQSGTWEYEIETGNFKWSEGMYKMFGLQRQVKVHPEIYLDFAVEEDSSIARKIVDHFKKKPNPFEEILRIKRNNDERTLKIKASVLFDENKKAQKIIGVDVDVSDVRKAEEKLQESRHWLEQTAKTSPDSITIYDPEKKQPIYLNDCLSEWTGVSNDELIEMGFEERLKLIHPDDRLTLLHFNEKIAQAGNGDVLTMEYRLRKNDKEWIWLRNRCKVFQRNESGKVTHHLSILQNVTDEVELREQLKQRTQFAEAILNASVDRITVFDRNYKFVGWNQRCEQIHRKSREEVIGKSIFEMFPGIEKHPVFMNAQQQSLKGEFIHVPMVQDGYTGDYLELFYIPLKNQSGETYAVVNIMHDVSNYVATTEALNSANKKLENKNIELEQKNEEITSFAFVASHDMKEPLRKIHTFSDWLMEQEKEHLSEKGKSMIEKISTSVNRMEVLIDDILILTKIHSDLKKEDDVNLNSVLKQVIEDMSEQISTTQTCIHTDELPVVKGNANQIFYLFKNLLSNAIKFQKPGNVPQIKINAEIVSGNGIDLAKQHDEYAKISFRDNGFGFDQRYAKKIFQVFQRLHGKHEFEGTGIGLAICKKIMENHNGMITVESELGDGSVFNCFFPLH